MGGRDGVAQLLLQQLHLRLQAFVVGLEGVHDRALCAEFFEGKTVHGNAAFALRGKVDLEVGVGL
jgi:hypothetical protein